VQCHHGTLTVSARRGIPLFLGGAIDIDIALPSRSRVLVSVATADLRAEGEFAECELSSASGNLDVDAVQGNLTATTASGSITVQAVAGNVSVATASGNATFGQLDGDLKFKAASGDLSVGRLCGRVHARTASGSVTITTAVRGAISACSSSGRVGVGIAEGTSARLDLITPIGEITNLLEPADGPGEGEDTLLIHARTASGDIDIHRAVPTRSRAGG
jgi:DUF4097 and DUF4098 domain-containing protein YvlB